MSVTQTNHIASTGRRILNNELERIWKDELVAYVLYPSTGLERLRKTAENSE
jgi:hypothetical protein